MRSIGNGFALICLSLCMGWLAVGQAQGFYALPSTTSLYYTVVSAGFGNLGISYHYEEYGNSATNFTLSIGRYYSPSTVEYTDFTNNAYYLETINSYGWETCQTYTLNTLSGQRVLGGATSLLVNMGRDNVGFTPMGFTTQVRSQPSRHYSASLAWTSTTLPTTRAGSLDAFISAAFGTAGVTTASYYTVSATVDVYFACDNDANLLMAGSGFIPLRFTITGSRTDGSIVRPLNIVYDFMQYAQLDYWTALFALESPYYWCAWPDGSLPMALPQFSLGAINTTVPNWSAGGRATMEITTNTNNNNNYVVVQIDSLLKSVHGQELLIYLADPTNYIWYSRLYEYAFTEERNYQFSQGSVYTLNGTDANPYNEWDFDFTYSFCTGSKINPNTVSPIQWLNAGSLDTIIANPNFLKGAQPAGRQTIRGIMTDTWTINKGMAYNAVMYNYTLTIYVTVNGWGNLGRTNMPTIDPRQLIRLSYNGIKSPTGGSASAYTLNIDFFMQYIQQWNSYSEIFNPADWYCPTVQGAVPILPPLPAQYSVSVSETWYESSTSSQYTVYADTARNLKRIDGKFTNPQTFSLWTDSVLSTDYLSMVEWTQNVTLVGGFSSMSLAAQQSYTAYSPNQAHTCGAVTLSWFDWSGVLSLNFFDWLAQADPSTGVYVSSKNVRGMDVDVYQITMQTENYGHFILANMEIAFLAPDETLINNIPVMAEVVVQFYNYPYFYSPSAQYQFYNFRQGVPPGIFGSPQLSSCMGYPVMPTPVVSPAYYEDPSYISDGTPRHAPLWPTVFSMMIEGQLFAGNGDMNYYIARWYADYKNYRERLDIEPAFNISGANGVTPQQVSYIYYYTKEPGNTFQFTTGTRVVYNGTTCRTGALSSATRNPLKQVPPGNLFDMFFPQTTIPMSGSSYYNSYPRWDWLRQDGFFYDEYDWYTTTTFGGKMYSLTSSIYVSILEWVNNAQAGIWNNTRIPISVQANGAIFSSNGQTYLGEYNTVFKTTFYQARQPGYALFDASLLGCRTTAASPWYNIYGDISANSQSVGSGGSSSPSSGTIAGAVVGSVGGVLVLAVLFLLYRFWKRNNATYFGGTNGTTANGKTTDNELVGVGKRAANTNDAPAVNKPVKEHKSAAAAAASANTSDRV